VNCEVTKEAISALLDGEVPGVTVVDVDRHLESCHDCRSWREAAHAVTRRARIDPILPGIRRTDEVLAAARSTGQLPRRPSTAALARLGLMAIAAVQIAITVPVLVFGKDHGVPGHIAHEMGSFDAALAVGFLVAAWRPGRALGMRTLIGAVAVLLALTAVIDLARGATDLYDEAPHLLALGGWLLVRHLAAVSAPTVEDPGSQALAWLRSLVSIQRRRSGELAGLDPLVDQHPPTAACDRDRAPDAERQTARRAVG
jgi:predicted anti-sigma-YlaC factor YlaD